MHLKIYLICRWSSRIFCKAFIIYFSDNFDVHLNNILSLLTPIFTPATPPSHSYHHTHHHHPRSLPPPPLLLPRLRQTA